MGSSAAILGRAAGSNLSNPVIAGTRCKERWRATLLSKAEQPTLTAHVHARSRYYELCSQGDNHLYGGRTRFHSLSCKSSTTVCRSTTFGELKRRPRQDGLKSRVLRGLESSSLGGDSRLGAQLPLGGNAPSKRGEGKRHWRISAAARDSDGKSYYELLGVPESADEKEIKKAYRRMALKYHPDVNKEKGAEAAFVKIKQAYTTLSDSKSRSLYDSQLRGGSWGFPGGGGATDWDPLDPFGYKKKPKGGKQEEEEFYGLGDFFRDLQKEVEGWQNDRSSSEAPKSLWEEMAEVGEEFVEFLEQELGLDENESKKRTEQRKQKPPAGGTEHRSESTRGGKESTDGVDGAATAKRQTGKDEKGKGDDIEDLLASLKKEMGL